MSTQTKKAPSAGMVVLAFATVYLVWGSTFFFIQKAVQYIPPFILGALRFTTAGLAMLIWSIYRKEDIWNWRLIRTAAISGMLLLLLGNGSVIWAEQTLPSSLAAVLISSSPLWFVLLDVPKWKENLTNRETVTGLVVGFVGVILLFSERIKLALSENTNHTQLASLLILLIAAMSWSGGSLYSKYKFKGSATVNSTWQMLAAGIAFIPIGGISHEWSHFHWEEVPASAWLSVFYLVSMGSLAGYSAYVWLLEKRPATQVSTYAYVNPVVAVLLGVFFAGESMSVMQLIGLTIVLASVLLINLSKYRSQKTAITESPDKIAEVKQDVKIAG